MFRAIDCEIGGCAGKGSGCCAAGMSLFLAHAHRFFDTSTDKTHTTFPPGWCREAGAAKNAPHGPIYATMLPPFGLLLLQVSYFYEE